MEISAKQCLLICMLLCIYFMCWRRGAVYGFSGFGDPSPELVFPPHFSRCDRRECIAMTTCPETVVGVSKGRLPVMYSYSNKASFVSNCIS